MVTSPTIASDEISENTTLFEYVSWKFVDFCNIWKRQHLTVHFSFYFSIVSLFFLFCSKWNEVLFLFGENDVGNANVKLKIINWMLNRGGTYFRIKMSKIKIYFQTAKSSGWFGVEPSAPNKINQKQAADLNTTQLENKYPNLLSIKSN